MTYRDHTEMLLRAMPGTRAHLRTTLHVSRSSVQRWLSQLHACGWCHIDMWIPSPDSGPFQPVYAAGQGVDADCTLTPQTASVSSKKSRSKAVRDGRRAFQLAKERAHKRASRLRASGKTATPFDALMTGGRRN